MDVVDVTLMDSWAEEEFAAAALGDARRTKRLIQLAHTFGQRPALSLPDGAQDPAMLKAAYRFFDTDAIDPAAMLASHIASTYDRCATVARVLAVQDTTELDWSQHPHTTGLGPIHTKNHRGMLVHSMLGITPDRVPLGLLQQHVWVRDETTFGQLPDHHTRPFADKESVRWADGLAAVNAARAACPATHFIMVADAEADIYELFTAERTEGVDLLIRAGQDRSVDDPETRRLWHSLPASMRVGTRVVRVSAQAGQPAREAEVTISRRTITLRPPRRPAGSTPPLHPVTLQVVWVTEERPPAGVEAIAWVLLTSVPVQSAAAALEVVDWYCCRWGIEIWHKALNSGCAIERRQLETAARLQRCLTLFSVIAWRIVYTTMLARACPEVPCTAILDEDEWQALYCTVHRTPTPPPTPPAIGEAVRWIARLGGFQGRTGDGAPGIMVMWKGFQHLADLTTMYRIMRPRRKPGHVGNE